MPSKFKEEVYVVHHNCGCTKPYGTLVTRVKEKGPVEKGRSQKV
jgi:hypothetical protein